MKTGVLLAGCGVFDGTAIHEAVCALLSLKQNNLEYICIAPDISQHHVLNHVSGEEIQQKRNVLLESARIARGNIRSLDELDYNEINSLVIPGGFGAAKNLSDWAFNGPESTVNKDVKKLLHHCLESSKPIVALCIAPTLLAKTLVKEKQGSLTVGSTKSPSEYNIEEIHQAMNTLGINTQETTINEICVDEENKIITAPCYMMDVGIDEVYDNIKQAINRLVQML